MTRPAGTRARARQVPIWRRGVVHSALRTVYAIGDELRLRTRRLVRSRPRRVLLAYWGSMPNGRPTLGDRLAVVALARALRLRGIEADVASLDTLPADVSRLAPETIAPRRYGAMVFVCGPLTAERALLRFAHRFHHAARLAVGVSLIDGHRTAQRMYDAIVARDGVPERPGDTRHRAAFDLALAGEATDTAAWNECGPSLLCLRGPQSEYGDARCLAGSAREMLHTVADRLGHGIASVDTVLGGKTGDAREIESAFGGARVVLTTRLHGALLALRAGVPLVAVDQIAGGAKVTEVLAAIGYPFAYCADRVTTDALEHAARQACAPEFRPQLLQLRERAMALSQAALQDTVDEVERWLP